VAAGLQFAVSVTVWPVPIVDDAGPTVQDGGPLAAAQVMLRSPAGVSDMLAALALLGQTVALFTNTALACEIEGIMIAPHIAPIAVTAARIEKKLRFI